MLRREVPGLRERVVRKWSGISGGTGFMSIVLKN
jgi:hypothetical protein